MKNKIPPPILLLITGILMWPVAHSDFAYAISVPYPLVLSLLFVLSGFLVAFLAMRQFGVVETTVNPLDPASATSLVSTGVFGRSRNPMYVGLLLILAGWAVWLGSLTNIAVILLFVVVITELQIKPEEEALSTVFGKEYEEYCRKVRRWF